MALRAAAGLAGVAVVGAIALALFTGDGEEPPPAAEAPYPDVRADEIDRLEIRGGESPIRLERPKDAWKLREPVSADADPRAVEEALDALARAEFSAEPVAAGPSSWPRYEVEADEVITAVAYRGDRPLPALHVGRSGFVRVGSGDAIYEVPDLSRDVLTQEVSAWRDLAVLDAADDEIAAIEVIDAEGRRARADRAPGAEASGVRDIRDDAWVLTSGAAHAEPFDPGVPASLARYLLSLRAVGAAEPPEKAPPSDPKLRIRLYSERDVVELSLGRPTRSKTPLFSSGAEPVWLLSHTQARELSKGPLQWRNRRLVTLEPGDLAAFEIEHEGRSLRVTRGGGWQLERPEGARIDAGAAEALARELSRLEADAVPDGPVEIPEGSAAITLEDTRGGAIELAIGERGDGTFVASSSERDDVLLMSQQRATTLLKDAFALARSGDGEGAGEAAEPE